MTKQPSYERRIEVALQDAQAFLPLNTFLDGLRGVPYDTLLRPFPATFTRNPGDVVFDDMDELPDVLQVLQNMTGIVVDQPTMELVQAHETQHRWAASTLKSPGSVFGMNLRPGAEPGIFAVRYYFHFPLDFQIDKLGLALIFGHPKYGLWQDKKDINRLGFSGIQEIGELALAENARVGQHKYPVPLSFHSDNSGYYDYGD